MREIAPRYRILYIEDYEPAAITLDFLLDDLGHMALHARSGAQALQFIETLAFDLVLIDIHIPDMNGYEIVEAIRTLDTYHDDMVLVGFTADIDSIDREKSGLFDFVGQKKLDPESLRRDISRWMDSDSF